MAKVKVANQPTRVKENWITYDEHAAREGYNELPAANPDTLVEGQGYWHVDEATRELQAKVRLMLEKAKQVLTQQQYNAFVLVDLKHLKLRDAAKVMEVNHARVDQLIKRARLKLQAVYNGLE